MLKAGDVVEIKAKSKQLPMVLASLEATSRDVPAYVDFLTAQFMLPAGAFLTSIMLGWFVSRRLVQEEFLMGQTHDTSRMVKRAFFHIWLFSVRFVVPICILLIFLHQFGVI